MHLQQNKQQNLDLKKWVDPECQHYNNVQLNGNTLTAISYANIFSKNKIEGSYTYTATFSKIGGNVALGVADARNKDGWKNNNGIWFWSSQQCSIAGDLLDRGKGFQVGEKVVVNINLKLGVIQWRVGHQIRNKQNFQLLKDKNIDWVPFIAIVNKDDIVEITEE